jgi:hypothetical protein
MDYGRRKSLKIEIPGFFTITIIMSYIENLGLWTDWGVSHGHT